jgi:hypothetical protein
MFNTVVWTKKKKLLFHAHRRTDMTKRTKQVHVIAGLCGIEAMQGKFESLFK